MSYYVSGIVLRLIRLLRRDTFEDGVRYHAVTALSDGAPVFIGYADIRVSSPDQRHTVTWTYAGEPPFGDSVNQVFLMVRRYRATIGAGGTFGRLSLTTSHWTVAPKVAALSMWFARPMPCG